MKSRTLVRQEERAAQSRMAIADQEQQEVAMDWTDYSGYQITQPAPPPYDPPRYPTSTCNENPRKSNDEGAVVLFWLTILILIGILLPVLAVIWDEGLIDIGGPVFACLPMGFALTTVFVVTIVTFVLTLSVIWLLSAAADVIVVLNYVALWLSIAAAAAYFLIMDFICSFLAALALLIFITVFFNSRRKERCVFSCYIQQASKAILCHPSILLRSALSGALKFIVLFVLNFLALELSQLPFDFCFKASVIAFVTCASLWIAAIISGTSQARLACLFRSVFCCDCDSNCCVNDRFGSIIYSALISPAYNMLYWVTDDIKPCTTINAVDFVLDNIGSLIFRCAQLGSHYLYIFIGMNGDNFQEASTATLELFHQCGAVLYTNAIFFYFSTFTIYLWNAVAGAIIGFFLTFLWPTTPICTLPPLTFGALVAVVVTNVMLEALYNGIGVLEVLWKCCPQNVVGDYHPNDGTSSESSNLW